MKDFKKIFVAGAEDVGWREELKKTLQHWIKCMEQFASYEQLQGNYTPFWYNERAHVGFLAGGAWRANRQNFALEEFRTKKQHDDGESTGRGDLMLRLDDTLLCCECKAVRASLNRPRPKHDPWRIGRKSLLQAKSDAESVSLNHVERWERAGISFLVPTIDEEHVDQFVPLRDGFLEELEQHAGEDPLALVPPGESLRTDFWAAYFPAWAKTTMMADVKRDKRWAGVVLLGTTLGHEG